MNTGQTYTINLENGQSKSITCLICNMTSYHPEDIRHRYCGMCKEFHEVMAAQMNHQSYTTAQHMKLEQTSERKKLPFKFAIGAMITILILAFIHMVKTNTGIVAEFGPVLAAIICVATGILGVMIGYGIVAFMSKKVTKPRYVHDCSKCKFLGIHQEYDLYWCAQGGLPTVIARYSSNGPDYLSGGSWATTGPLAIARDLAVKAGYKLM